MTSTACDTRARSSSRSASFSAGWETSPNWVPTPCCSENFSVRTGFSLLSDGDHTPCSGWWNECLWLLEELVSKDDAVPERQHRGRIQCPVEKRSAHRA